MKMRLAALALLALPLAACASSNLTVEQPMRAAPMRVTTVTLQQDQSNVTVTDDAKTYLDTRMRDAFYDGETPAFRQGNDLTVRYRFVSFERGSRALRYLVPFIAGGSTMIVEAEFIDPQGNVLSRVRGQGQVNGGIAGGSHNSAIESAVGQIRDYAVQTFGQRRTASR